MAEILGTQYKIVQSDNGGTITTTDGKTYQKIGNFFGYAGMPIFTHDNICYGNLVSGGGGGSAALPSVNYYYNVPRTGIYGFDNSFTRPKRIAKTPFFYPFVIGNGGCWVGEQDLYYTNLLTGEKTGHIIDEFNKDIGSMFRGSFYTGLSYNNYFDQSIDKNGNLIHSIPFQYPFNLGGSNWLTFAIALLINGKIKSVKIPIHNGDYFMQAAYGYIYDDNCNYQVILFVGGNDHNMVKLYDTMDGEKYIGKNDSISCDLKIGVGLDGKPIIKHCEGSLYGGLPYPMDAHGIITDCMGFKSYGLVNLRNVCQVDSERYLMFLSDKIILFNKRTKLSRVVEESYESDLNWHTTKLPYDMKRKIKSVLRKFQL